MKKKFFFHKWKKNTAVSGILLLLQLLVLVFFLLQYTVSYSEDFFSRCEDFFPKQLSKTCGSYEKIFLPCLPRMALITRVKCQVCYKSINIQSKIGPRSILITICAKMAHFDWFPPLKNVWKKWLYAISRENEFSDLNGIPGMYQ